MQDRRSVKTRLHSRFRPALERLQRKIAGIKAIVVVRSDGVVVEQLASDSSADTEVLASEFTTLVRIARRTSEDTGAGDLVEHILVSDNAVTIVRYVSEDHFLILVCEIRDQIGRARYELKQTAWELAENGSNLTLDIGHPNI